MLTKYEKETIITFNDAEETAIIYTCNKPLQTKLEKLSKEYVVFKLTKSDADSKTYECPKKLINIRKPKILTEKTKEKLRNLAQINLKSSGS